MHALATLLDWIRYSASRLAAADVYYGHGTDNALDEAAALVLGLLKLPYDLSPAYFAARLTDAEITTLRDALERRIRERIPVPYLTRRTLYGGYDFYIDERALIPRSPIAELIARDLAPWWPQDEAPERILDLCCGSGCLGILAQLQQPQAEVVLADLDPDALDVARINLARFRMADSVAICQGDGLAAVSGQFDWIICNPPYVEAAEMDDIAAEYRHEPRQALVSGADGLDFTRRLLREAPDYLTERGLLVLEVGMSWPQLEDAYPDAGFDWVEFERGGEGVCIITADELLAWREAGVV